MFGKASLALSDLAKYRICLSFTFPKYAGVDNSSYRLAFRNGPLPELINACLKSPPIPEHLLSKNSFWLLWLRQIWLMLYPGGSYAPVSLKKLKARAPMLAVALLRCLHAITIV